MRTNELLLELIFKEQTKAINVRGLTPVSPLLGKHLVTRDPAVCTMITKELGGRTREMTVQGIRERSVGVIMCVGEQHTHPKTMTAIPSVATKAQSACPTLDNKKSCQDGRCELSAYSAPSTGCLHVLFTFIQTAL